MILHVAPWKFTMCMYTTHGQRCYEHLSKPNDLQEQYSPGSSFDNLENLEQNYCNYFVRVQNNWDFLDWTYSNSSSFRNNESHDFLRKGLRFDGFQKGVKLEWHTARCRHLQSRNLFYRINDEIKNEELELGDCDYQSIIILRFATLCSLNNSCNYRYSFEIAPVVLVK